MKRLWVRVSVIISVLILFILFVITMASFFFPDTQSIQIIEPHPMGMDGNMGMLFGRFRAPTHMVILYAFIAFAGMGVGVWVGRGISRPIANLADAAQKLGAGDLSYRVNERTGSQELNELSHAFNKMAEELERAEELRNFLMADISHELRGPLTVLEGNLRAGLDHVVELNEKELANLYGQTRHLIRLVNDLRELALAESGHLPLTYSSVAVNTLVEEVIWNYALIAEEKGVRITSDLAPGLPPLNVDEVRMRQIISNLISNAIRHTPKDGAITVSITQDAEHYNLRITDTGEGIDAKHIPHLFDRFYRTDKSRQRETGGSGLGLAIVKALTESMGGSVTGTSKGLGQGATFIVTLPKKHNLKQRNSQSVLNRET
ncbi:MAG: HAMP domain-containing sensor histidine kinase [Anaerolineae bacterium]|nr:HAMP domain-containing sensor histidine kinase [Anaerolineae bacterium]